jgi:CheY-like chemotaxis protein
VVLIADDDELMRSLTAATLDNEGFETIAVANGQEAIAALARVQPNLLLLDVDMPVMDGFTACERIRAMPVGGDLPIVIVTGKDTASMIVPSKRVRPTSSVNP